MSSRGAALNTTQNFTKPLEQPASIIIIIIINPSISASFFFRHLKWTKPYDDWLKWSVT